MKMKQFIGLVYGEGVADTMTKGQEQVVEAIERGELKLIGMDYGDARGDRTAKIYGTYDNKNCQFIIDDIEQVG